MDHMKDPTDSRLGDRVSLVGAPARPEIPAIATWADQRAAVPDPIVGTESATAGPAPRLLWTTEEAAARLAVSPRLLERLTAERRIAATRVGRVVRYSEDSLRRFIADSTSEPIASAAPWPLLSLMPHRSGSAAGARFRRTRSR
jgi:excisionase family DNA binding protein